MSDKVQLEPGDEIVLKTQDGTWTAIVRNPKKPGGFAGTIQHYKSFDEAAASIKKMFSIP